jgi:zinc protease
MRVRDEKQLVTAIGSSLYAPSFSGLFTISAFPMVDKYTEAVAEISKTLEDFIRNSPIQQEELDRAKAHLKMQRILEAETVEGTARTVGFSLTTDQSHHFEDYYYDIINQASCDDVMATAWRYLKQKKYVVVGMLPNESDITNDEVAAAIDKNLNLQKQPVFLRESSKGSTANDEVKIDEDDIGPGIKLVYRQRPESELLSLSLAAEGGTRGEGAEDSGLYNCISSLIARSTKSQPYPEFTTRIENIGASIDGFSGKDSYGLSLQGLSEHRDKLFSGLASSLNEPDFTEMHWAMTRQQILQTIESENDQPSRIAIRELKNLVYGDHPYHRPTYGTAETMGKFNEKNLLERFTEIRDQSKWVLGAVSPLPVAEFVKEIKTALQDWSPKPNAAAFIEAEKLKAFTPGKEKKVFEKDREQTHIVIGYKGLDWSDPDREKLDVLSSILGGMGGRLFTRLRDQNSLAYTVAPMTAHGYHPGIFGCYIACAPGKTEQALTQLEEELDKVCETVCSADELSRAQRYILGNHESEYQQSDSQAMTMSLMELFGLGADDFMRYRERLLKVQATDVQKIARRLFDKDHLVKVIVGKQS